MQKEFCVGLIIGMLAGALVVNNVPKAKKMLDKGQKTFLKKLKELTGKSQPQQEDARE